MLANAAQSSQQTIGREDQGLFHSVNCITIIMNKSLKGKNGIDIHVKVLYSL